MEVVFTKTHPCPKCDAREAEFEGGLVEPEFEGGLVEPDVPVIGLPVRSKR